MPRLGKKILMVFDLPEAAAAGMDHRAFLRRKEWRDENQVASALQARGYQVDAFGIYNDLTPLLLKLQNNPYDLVFFLAECFDNQRHGAAHLAGTLELMKVPFTGPGAASLRLCQDKGLSKAVLKYQGIAVPDFRISPFKSPLIRFHGLNYPCIVKPLNEEASEGLSLSSVVHNEDDCRERVGFLHNRFQDDVIIEEFIIGRDIYVGVLGNDKLKIFPPQELMFKKPRRDLESFATWKVKWDPAYRQRWGIHTGPAQNLSLTTRRHISDTSKQIYRILGLRGYARLDLRLQEDGRAVFLEANPNPSIARDDEFAKGAQQAGLPYEELIQKIVKLAS